MAPMQWLRTLLGRSRASAPESYAAPVLLANTRTGRVEPFSSARAGTATLYSCGPTVYARSHIGNLRSYVFADTLARTLAHAGYRVRRAINLTDVGHLVGDGDAGEDKMEEGSRAEGARARDVADRYIRLFMEDIAALGLDTGAITFPRATEYIDEQIALAKILEEKGYAYLIDDGLYFDTARFPGYGGAHDAGESRIGANAQKRSAADFALWKRSPKPSAEHPKRQQEWPSPWGVGFPGWHLECSAMVRALLGQPVDIHTGGIDHIPVHHANEIAQSEAAFGVPLARFWMHNAFLTIGDRKLSKSEGADIHLPDVVARGHAPRALRYLFLQARYSSELAFSWESLDAAANALARLQRLARTVHAEARGRSRASDRARRFVALVRDDLGTPAALALLWDALKDEDLGRPEQLALLELADRLLGLDLLADAAPDAVPAAVQALVDARERARMEGDFARADELRIHIRDRGYAVEDGPSGPVATRTPR